MTRPSSPWPVAALAMTGFTLFALAVSIGGRVLSPSLVLDLAALWPLLILLVPAVVAALLRPGSRLAGSGPVIVLTWVLAGLALHLAGWSQLPSSVADVTSPVAQEAERARLAMVLEEGEATVRGGTVFSARMERIGGRTGAPDVSVSGSDPVLLSVEAPVADGWFRFGGVIVELPTEPAWTVEVDAPVVDLDLTRVAIAGLDVRTGAGTLRLGDPEVSVLARVSGPIRIVVPDGIAASVTGPARVPASWVTDGDGFRSVADGEGWIFEVDPSEGSVVIQHP